MLWFVSSFVACLQISRFIFIGSNYDTIMRFKHGKNVRDEIEFSPFPINLICRSVNVITLC